MKMEILNAYHDFLNELQNDENVITVSLVGSASDIEEKYFYKLADIDLFVVKKVSKTLFAKWFP